MKPKGKRYRKMKEKWTEINKFSKREIDSRQLKKDLEILEDEV